MKRLLAHISKSLVLLTVILLPVEQAWSATCCCRGDFGRAVQSAAGSQKSCCSRSQSTCCGTANSQQGSCCHHGQPESGSKPCHCSGGCYGGHDALDVGAPATFRTPSDDELAATAIQTIALDAAIEMAPDSLRSTFSHRSTGGLQRCVRLCRYRL